MIKFNGQKVINVGGQDALYLSYEIQRVAAWGRDIYDVAHAVVVDMEKQNVNIGRQAQREGQEGIFLAAHFRFNDDDVVVHRHDTAAGVKQAYLDMLQKRHDDYDASPEGIAAREKYEQEISDKTEMARNLLDGIMRQSHLYKNRGALHQPMGVAADELMKDLYTFIKLADDIPNENWDQDTFIESMKRFNYVSSEHVGKTPDGFFVSAVKRAFIVGQAMNFVDKQGCFHQTLLVLLERYFKNPDEKPENENQKRNGGEQTDA